MARRPNPSAPQSARATVLQQDPVCGTYVAVDNSLKRIVSGRVVHFCSPSAARGISPDCVIPRIEDLFSGLTHSPGFTGLAARLLRPHLPVPPAFRAHAHRESRLQRPALPRNRAAASLSPMATSRRKRSSPAPHLLRSAGRRNRAAALARARCSPRPGHVAPRRDPRHARRRAGPLAHGKAGIIVLPVAAAMANARARLLPPVDADPAGTRGDRLDDLAAHFESIGYDTPRSVEMVASIRFAAASSMCFRPTRPSPCASNFSATKSNPSAASIPNRSAPFTS